MTGIGTKSATSTGVELTNGRIINSSTVVATIGNGPHPLVQTLGLNMHWGRIKTDRFMRVPGQDHVWALGDAALIPLKDNPGEDPADYATQTAQFAVREGYQLARNIVAKIKGEELKPFAYKSKGSLASLGMSKAVADVYGVKLSGVFAWLLWRGFYLSFLPGFVARFRVGLNWIINAIMPPNIVQLRMPPPATRYIHFWKRDKVFEPGPPLQASMPFPPATRSEPPLPSSASAPDLPNTWSAFLPPINMSNPDPPFRMSLPPLPKAMSRPFFPQIRS